MEKKGREGKKKERESMSEKREKRKEGRRKGLKENKLFLIANLKSMV